MPRLRHRVTGVVVNVSDDTASRLGTDYEAVRETKRGQKSKSEQPEQSEQAEDK